MFNKVTLSNDTGIAPDKRVSLDTRVKKRRASLAMELRSKRPDGTEVVYAIRVPLVDKNVPRSLTTFKVDNSGVKTSKSSAAISGVDLLAKLQDESILECKYVVNNYFAKDTTLFIAVPIGDDEYAAVNGHVVYASSGEVTDVLGHGRKRRTAPSERAADMF